MSLKENEAYNETKQEALEEVDPFRNYLDAMENFHKEVERICMVSEANLKVLKDELDKVVEVFKEFHGIK